MKKISLLVFFLSIHSAYSTSLDICYFDLQDPRNCQDKQIDSKYWPYYSRIGCYQGHCSDDDDNTDSTPVCFVPKDNPSKYHTLHIEKKKLQAYLNYGCYPGSGLCLTNCKRNICGDGFAHYGIEECDFGLANSNNRSCTTSCLIAKCGDGYIWEGFEACDEGHMNGAGPGHCKQDCSGITPAYSGCEKSITNYSTSSTSLASRTFRNTSKYRKFKFGR